PVRDRGADRHALGADREAVGGALDVRPDEHAAVGRLERRAHPELAVRAVGVFLHVAGAAHQLGAHAQTSARNDVPAASGGGGGGVTPKYSATVAPRSANVLRPPRAAGRTRGPSARIGTASREWTVDGVVGSFPWSAVRMIRSSPVRRASSRGIQASSCFNPS